MDDLMVRKKNWKKGNQSSGRRTAFAWILPVHPLLCVLCLLLLSCAASQKAQASAAILLEQPYGGMGRFNPTGHSALYFDHICAATPVRLRPCTAGESGVVISRYDGIGKLDWVAIPLVPYLYAVDDPESIPASMDRLTVVRLRDLYRREHLESVAPDTSTGGMPQGNWYELIGSAYDRTIYGFQVNTTPEQDAHLIAVFNDRVNVTRYNGAFRNCADFVRTTMNQVYPNAIHRNYIADLGLTTPKAVAHSLTHYAERHPETGFETFQIHQVAGDLPRSVEVQGVTESLLKRYGAPLVVLSPHVTAAVLVAYIGKGRFSMPRHAPELDLVALGQTANPAYSTVLNDSGRARNFETAVAVPTSEGKTGPAFSVQTAWTHTGFDGSFSSTTPAPSTVPVAFDLNCAGCGYLLPLQ